MTFLRLAKVVLLCSQCLGLVSCSSSDSFDFLESEIQSSQPTPTPEPIVNEPDLSPLVESIVTAGTSSLPSGSSTTIQLQLRRTVAGGASAIFEKGDYTVTFYFAGGSSSGTFGSTSYLGSGMYRASFTGVTAGTSVNVFAVIQGLGQVASFAPVQVVPGAISLANSTTTITPSSVAAGATALVKLQTRDANGNAMGSAGGGRAVAFALQTGGGLSTGSFGPVTSGGDGTYTCIFTAGTPGSAANILTTIDAQALSSTNPTVQVVSAPPPTDLSFLTFSQITLASPTVASGSSVSVTLSVRQTNGMGGSIPVTGGGLSVLFFATGGSSTGTFSATVTDDNDGTYTGSFTGAIAGTGTTIRAIISGYGLVADTETLTVIPGTLSLAQSTISVSPSIVFSGSNSVFTLTTRDAAGNALGSAGAGRTVSFSVQVGPGISTGTLDAVSDEGDGTYIVNFTGSTVGAAALVTATINSSLVTSTSPTVLVVASPAPSLTSVADRTFANNNPVIAGGAPFTFNLQNTQTNSDLGMTYTCDYETDFSGNYSTPCTSLPGTSVTFDTGTGAFSWQTSATLTWGAFAFRVTGTKSGLTDTKEFLVNVRQPYTTTDLLVNLDPSFADGKEKPGKNTAVATTLWRNLVASGSAQDGTVCGFACNSGLLDWLMTSSSGWNGNGTTLSPNRLVFNGTNGALNLGPNITDSTLTLSLWVRFGNIQSSQNGSFILSNGGGFGNGIFLKQSSTQTGTLVFGSGLGDEYSAVVLRSVGSGANQQLQGYWRMQDSTSATPLYDSCISCNQGLQVQNTARLTYTGGGPATNNEPTDKSIQINVGGATYLHTDMGSKLGVNDYSFDAWIFTNTTQGGIIMNTSDQAAAEGTNCSRLLYMNTAGQIGFRVFPDVNLVGNIVANSVNLTSPIALNNSTWHHVAVTHDVESSNGTVRMYINGVETQSQNVNGLYNQGSANRFLKIGSENHDGIPAGYQSNATCNAPANRQQFFGFIDEVAIYTRVLSAAEIKTRYKLGRGAGTNSVCKVTGIVNNAWYHLGLAYSTDSVQLHVARPGIGDANNLTSDCSVNWGSNNSGSSLGSRDFYIGSDPDGGNEWQGAIGDFKAYTSDTVDGPLRIDNVYQHTKSRFP